MIRPASRSRSSTPYSVPVCSLTCPSDSRSTSSTRAYPCSGSPASAVRTRNAGSRRGCSFMLRLYTRHAYIGAHMATAPARRRHRPSQEPHRPETHLRPHPGRTAHQAHRGNLLHHPDHAVKSPAMGRISRKLRAVGLRLTVLRRADPCQIFTMVNDLKLMLRRAHISQFWFRYIGGPLKIRIGSGLTPYIWV